MVLRNRPAQDTEPIQIFWDGVSFTLSDLPTDEDFPLADYRCEDMSWVVMIMCLSAWIKSTMYQ